MFLGAERVTGLGGELVWTLMWPFLWLTEKIR